MNRRRLLIAGAAALAAGAARAQETPPADPPGGTRYFNQHLLETDRRGRRVVRAQVIAINPNPSGIAAMRRLGFRRLEHTRLPELELEIIVVIAPRRYSAEEALEVLRRADPDGSYELNHIYDRNEAAGVAPSFSGPIRRPGVDGAGLRLGMIDSGVKTDHRCFAGASIQQRGFAGEAVASTHGTAVASLLIGKAEGFSGYAPGASLFAADVFGQNEDGGSAQAVAEALNWLVASGVNVINMSLAGPANRLVEIACAAAAGRGIALVASVGNAGPSQPVAYPAAYDSVIAATAVDGEGQVFLMANRGPEVAFAASGVGIEAAHDAGDFTPVSGTSFAAPQVSALLAGALRETGSRESAIARLCGSVRDVGQPGRDPVYGFGIIT